jgi:hypothetical protein
MGCLDEQTVVAFVSGGLNGAALAEVERHLVDCPACTALVAVAAPEGSAPAAPVVPAAGATVGRYRLLRLVGRGGIGEVWAAHDPELDRNVAIKILRGDTYVDDVDSARLLREARAIANLTHPNVVAMYDVGTAAGRVFLAMELVDGETLAAWLDRAGRTLDEIVRVFVMAGRGLGAAHRAGIIHRDFKPQNVMVAADGGVRVTDFGLAARGGGKNDPRLTRIGSILGTPIYMAPEQLRGEPVDARADQFGFCVALYEALYGERPFPGSSFSELRAAVLAGRPRPAPATTRVPGRLRAVLLRGLAVDREGRFPDMDALLAALIAAARGGGHQAKRLAILGAAAFTVAAASALGWRHLRAPRASNACSDVRARLASAWPMTDDDGRRHDVHAAFLASAVPDALRRYDCTAAALDAYASAWATAAAQSCEAAVGGQAPPRAGSALQTSACLDQRLTELDALTEVLAHSDAGVVRKAIDAALSLPPVALCNDAAALRAQVLPPETPALRVRVDGLQDRLLRLRAMAAAGQDWQALQPIGALLGEVRAAGYAPLLAETLLVSARIRSPFDPEGAVPLYEEAFDRSRAIHNDLSAAEAAIQLCAIVGAVQHKFEAGDRWAHTAEELVERGHQDRLRARLLANRAALNAARGRWRLAAADLSAAVAASEQTPGPAPPQLAAALVSLARADLALGAPDQALDASSRALDIVTAIYPADSYEVAGARLARGAALLALAHPEDARPELEAALESFERALGRDHPLLADPMTALGQLALQKGHPGDARALLERAWEMRSTHVADGGAREETAFSLALAVWDAAPADRRHAIELAEEARDGYSALPDLSWRLAAIDRWLDARRARGPARRAHSPAL